MFKLDSSPERSEQITKQAKKWGMILLICGMTAPKILYRIANARAYVDRQMTPWPDDPGWLMKLAGSTLLNESDRRRARA